MSASERDHPSAASCSHSSCSSRALRHLDVAFPKRRRSISRFRGRQCHHTVAWCKPHGALAAPRAFTPYKPIACTVPTDFQYLIAVLAAARAGVHLSLLPRQDAPNMQSHPLGEANVRTVPPAMKTKQAVDLICSARANGSDINYVEVPTLLTMLDLSIAAAVLYDRVRSRRGTCHF